MCIWKWNYERTYKHTFQLLKRKAGSTDWNNIYRCALRKWVILSFINIHTMPFCQSTYLPPPPHSCFIFYFTLQRSLYCAALMLILYLHHCPDSGQYGTATFYEIVCNLFPMNVNHISEEYRWEKIVLSPTAIE